MTMAGSPLGGSGNQNPRDPTDDPLGPYTSRVTTVDAVLGVVFDDPEQFLDDVFSHVNDLPEEERSERAFEVLERHVASEFGSVDAFESALEVRDVPKAVEGTLRQLLDDTLEHVFYVRNPLGTLVASAAYVLALEALNEAEQAGGESDRRLAYSIVLSLLARIHEGGSRESIDEVWLESLAQDVARCTKELFGDDMRWELVRSESLTRARLIGAVVAYAELDISVSRGAELAEASVNEFEDALATFDVDVRYGPESTADLNGTLFDDA